MVLPLLSPEPPKWSLFISIPLNLQWSRDWTSTPRFAYKIPYIYLSPLTYTCLDQFLNIDVVEPCFPMPLYFCCLDLTSPPQSHHAAQTGMNASSPLEHHTSPALESKFAFEHPSLYLTSHQFYPFSAPWDKSSASLPKPWQLWTVATVHSTSKLLILKQHF